MFYSFGPQRSKTLKPKVDVLQRAFDARRDLELALGFQGVCRSFFRVGGEIFKRNINIDHTQISQRTTFYTHKTQKSPVANWPIFDPSLSIFHNRMRFFCSNQSPNNFLNDSRQVPLKKKKKRI
jgi:hypothetical protein